MNMLLAQFPSSRDFNVETYGTKESDIKKQNKKPAISGLIPSSLLSTDIE